MSSQHRGPLAVADFETGLQDHRRFPARQSRGVSRRVPPVRAAVPTPSTCTAASCWRSTGTRIKAVNNKGSQLHPLFAARVHPPRRRSGWKTTSSGSTRAMSRTARRGGGLHARRTWPKRLRRRSTKSAAVTSSDAGPARANRRGPDLADRSADSRAMAAHTKVGVGYNVQVAVDAKNKLIVEQAVTQPGRGHGPADGNFGAGPRNPGGRDRSMDVVADRGYFKIEDIEACEQAGCVPHVAKPQARLVGAARACFARTSSDTTPELDAYASTPGREVADADPPRPDARSRKDRLRQPESLPPRLPAAPAMHERRPLRFPPRKRRRSRSHGRAPQSGASDSRPPPRGRRAPVRQHQSSGCIRAPS